MDGISDPLYVHMARAYSSLMFCRSDAANDAQQAWTDRWEDRLEYMVGKLPHGSGFDVAVTLNDERSTAQRLVFNGSYHNMDQHGGYCGWTDYALTLKPCLMGGFVMRVTGGDRHFKDYVHDTFEHVFRERYLAKELVPAYEQVAG